MSLSDEERLSEEVKHGKFICKSWAGTLWYWETPAGQIRWKRRLRMLTSHIRPEMEVLEIGCAVGYFTKEIAALGPRILAIDISPDLLEVARQEVKEPNVRFEVANAYDMPYQEGRFDTVVGSAILHHLDLEKALKEFHRVLKPGGSMYFTEPNMLNPQIFLERKVRFVGKMVGAIPHETAFIRGPLDKQLRRFGFTDIEIVPFDYLHPLTPRPMIPLVEKFGDLLEKIPGVREIAGSLYIRAKKPA